MVNLSLFFRSDMKKGLVCGTIFVMIVCWVGSLGCFYVGIAFCATWRTKGLTWLIGFIFAFIIDFVFFEFGVELLILAFFSCRKTSENSK
jgi:hypothetical protein